jgi:hypothetical protein
LAVGASSQRLPNLSALDLHPIKFDSPAGSS